MSTKYLFFTNECVGLGHLRRALALAGAVTEHDPRASALVVTGAPIELACPLPPRVDTIKLPLLARDSAGAQRAGRLGISLPDVRALRSQLALAAHAGRGILDVAQAEHELCAGAAQPLERGLELVAEPERRLVDDRDVGCERARGRERELGA